MNNGRSKRTGRFPFILVAGAFRFQASKGLQNMS